MDFFKELAKIKAELLKGNGKPAAIAAIEWRYDSKAMDALSKIVGEVEQTQHESRTAKLLDSQSQFNLKDW